MTDLNKKKDTALKNCITLMTNMGETNCAAEAYNSTPRNMVLAINNYERHKNNEQKGGIKLLVTAGIMAIPVVVASLGKPATGIHEVIKFVVIGVSAILSLTAGYRGAELLVDAGIIGKYLTAATAYIEEYYPKLINQIKTNNGRARVKK